MTDTAYDHLYKLVLVGDSGIGKSSILQKYVKDDFSESYVSTIGVDFAVKTIDLNGKIIKLQVWDTAGQERFRTITHSYYRGAHGIIVVFDLTNIESFHNISNWLHEINLHAKENVQILLVGTKSDRVNYRMITKDMIDNYVKTHDFIYIETSSKTGVGIDQIFTTMATRIMKNKINIVPVKKPNINDLRKSGPLSKDSSKEKEDKKCICN